jgi:hypothetical protein
MQGGMLFGVQPVSQGESGKCVDALITYATSAMSMSNTKYTSCTGVPAEPPLPSPNPRASAQEGDAESRRTSAAVCANEYIGCVSAGRNAMSSLDWQSAINDFQTAANLNPTSTEPWVLLGSIYERTGQGEELSKAWNKAIAMGGTISVGACLGRAPKSCERGRLSLSGSSISFSVKGNPVFSASPGEINSDTTPNGHEYSFQIAQIRYTFDFFPSRGTCAYNKAMVECPPEGTAQQLILARYVSQTMPRLSHAALAKEP